MLIQGFKHGFNYSAGRYMDHTHKILQAHHSIHNTEIIIMTKSTTNKHCLVKKNINATRAKIWWRDDTPSLSCFVLSNLLTSSVKSRCRFIKSEDLRIAEETQESCMSFVDL